MLLNRPFMPFKASLTKPAIARSGRSLGTKTSSLEKLNLPSYTPSVPRIALTPPRP
jgi:hypothetical protein